MADFCAKHDIDSQLRSIRLRKARRMPGEQAEDERVGMVETAFKTDVVIRGLDVVLIQLKDRFPQENVELLHEIINETLHSVQSYVFQCYKCTRH